MNEAVTVMAAIYLGLLTINLCAMVALWRGTGSTQYRTLALAWLGALVVLATVPASAAGSPTVRMLAFVPAILNYGPLGALLANIVGLRFPTRRFLVLLSAALVVGPLLDALGTPSPYSILPVSTAVAMPALYASVTAMRRHWATMSPVVRALAVTLMVHGLHGVDYGLSPSTPVFLIGGFSLAVGLAALVSVFGPASVLEHVTGERTKLQEQAKRAAAVKRILDNVDEGFFGLDLQGRLSDERSAILTLWFGPATPDQRFVDYAARRDTAFSEAFECAWDQVVTGALPVDVSLDQLPDRLVADDRILAVRYRPVLHDEELVEVIVVVSDITARVEHERAQANVRDLTGAVRAAIRDRDGFQEFAREADALVERIVGAADDSATLMRDIHTLKGNAAMFDVGSLSRWCHELEGRLRARDDGLTPAEAKELLSRWEPVRALVDRRDETRSRFLEVDEAEQRRLISMIERRAPAAEIVEEIRRWSSEPAARRLERLASHARTLAERLGKSSIEVVSCCGAVRLERGRFGPLWQALVHTVRNAIDHGLETPAERVDAGKPAVGRLELSTAYEASEIVFRIADDGRGIDWSKIQDEAARQGLPHRDHTDLVAALFSDGITSRTTASDLSGRGVGLGALSQVARSLRGTVHVQSTPGQGTCFELRFPAAPPEADVAGRAA